MTTLRCQRNYVFVLLLIGGSSACAECGAPRPSPGRYTIRFHTVLSRAEREVILQDPFKIVSSIAEIPSEVRSTFAEMAGQTEFEMADPGQAFQKTDMIFLRRLPWRRLAFAGVAPHKCFLFYEMGGFATTYHLVVFAIDPPLPARFLWAAASGESFSDLSQLRSAVTDEQRLQDSFAYPW
jgi:hypothetical protein